MLSLLVASLCAANFSLRAQAPHSIPEEIEWTWEVRPPHADARLPNVLLLGDSITRSYFPQVTKDLAGKANVYLMSSSTSVGDPRLPRQITEFGALEHVSFAVVHFNNGMHGWEYTEEKYGAAFPGFLAAVRSLPGHGKLIWATTTPVKADTVEAATNARVEARNAVAQAALRRERLPVDDLHALMLQHRDLHQDNVHFNETGAALMGDQAAALIEKKLPPPSR